MDVFFFVSLDVKERERSRERDTKDRRRRSRSREHRRRSRSRSREPRERRRSRSRSPRAHKGNITNEIVNSNLINTVYSPKVVVVVEAAEVELVLVVTQEEGNHLYIGMYPHQALNISPRFNIKLCRLLVKFLPIL